MKEKILKTGRLLLIIWGAFSLIVVILVAVYFIYSATFDNKTVINKATKSDVQFVLNWCGLGAGRIVDVSKSYTSARSFTGDYLDAYAIKISDITLEELQKGNDGLGSWYRCDSLPKVLNEAVSLAGGFHNEIPWFPEESKLKTPRFYVYPWSIYCHGIAPTATELIFIDPKNMMIYYIGMKM